MPIPVPVGNPIAGADADYSYCHFNFFKFTSFNNKNYLYPILGYIVILKFLNSEKKSRESRKNYKMRSTCNFGPGIFTLILILFGNLVYLV